MSIRPRVPVQAPEGFAYERRKYKFVRGSRYQGTTLLNVCIFLLLLVFIFLPEVYLWSLSLMSIMIFIISYEGQEVCCKYKYKILSADTGKSQNSSKHS